MSERCWVCERAFPDHDTLILHLVTHPGRTAEEFDEAARIRAEQAEEIAATPSDPTYARTAWPENYTPPPLNEIE